MKAGIWNEFRAVIRCKRAAFYRPDYQELLMCWLTKSSAESSKSLAACLCYDTAHAVPISHGKSIHTSMASVKITLRSKSWRVYLGIVLQRLELLKLNSLYIESKGSNVGLHIIFSLQTWLFLRLFSFHEARNFRKLFILNNR